MLRGIRRRLTYSNVVASLALFVALGGVSYAAVNLPRNSVGPSQIKQNAVTGSKVRNSSLTGSDIRNRSLTAADFSGSVQGTQGPAGAPGPAGPQGALGANGATGATGATGLQGTTGDPGLSGLVRVYTSGVNTNSNSPKTTAATCPAGKRVVSGGYDLSGAKSGGGLNGVSNIVVDVQLPTDPSVAPGSYYVEAWESTATASNWGVDAIALCADVTP